MRNAAEDYNSGSIIRSPIVKMAKWGDLPNFYKVNITNKSFQMLEGVMNTQPTSHGALGLVSTLATSPISTFQRAYGPSSQVDIGLVARVDTRPCMSYSFGFVYILYNGFKRKPRLSNNTLLSLLNYNACIVVFFYFFYFTISLTGKVLPIVHDIMMITFNTHII